jgi:protein TonB
MRNSPQVVAPKTPQVSTTQPTPKAQPHKPTPPNPQPQMATQLTPRPMPPQPKPAPPKPQPQQQQVDPLTGLPVLPPISAQTMAPPNQPQPLAVAPSQQQVAGSVHGAIGRSGDASPAAMKTALGDYKQRIYEIVGSYWYPQIDKAFGTIGVGGVSIRFTIHKDGTLSDVQVTNGDNQMILRNISVGALRSPAPFPPFPDELVKEIGDNYTDEFSFSVY